MIEQLRTDLIAARVELEAMDPLHADQGATFKLYEVAKSARQHPELDKWRLPVESLVRDLVLGTAHADTPPAARASTPLRTKAKVALANRLKPFVDRWAG